MTTETTMTGPPDVDDSLHGEHRRAATYKLLADCYHPPDHWRSTLEATADDEVAVSIDPLKSAATDRQALTLDHAQLFVGPFELAAPPYESVYIDDETRVMTSSSESVQATYRQAGVDIALEEPPDHVSPELEFLSLLVHTELEALAAGEIEAAEIYLEAQYDFLVNHLGRWVSELADNMREHAETEFYRLLAEETQQFVENDGRQLRDRLDRLVTDENILAVIEQGDIHDSR